MNCGESACSSDVSAPGRQRYWPGVIASAGTKQKRTQPDWRRVHQTAAAQGSCTGRRARKIVLEASGSKCVRSLPMIVLSSTCKVPPSPIMSGAA